ncbi:uncharacterized protein [Epargyreus clarus]|uniref:uncharacterized protein n=1 Tax=Epargyreus clarus TaxID=520877 RepID=UPI003C2E9B8A
MNGEVTESSEEERPCPLWERLTCGRFYARLCRRRLRRKVAPELGNNGKTRTILRSRESRRRINHPPSAQYSALSERVRTSAPAALQCALFCGGARCRYELPQQRSAAVQGLYSHWVTDDILAMARPSTANIAARNIIQQFHSWGIRSVINLQTPGEHASCGPPLTSSGFTYDPNIFMANDIYYYNFAWPDYGEATLSGLLDMAKVLSFALQEGRVAIHCHAVFARLYIEPINAVCRCKTKLHGKVALVTGGNSGIGLETARDMARRGARVIIACRDAKRSQEAIEDIARTTGNPNVEFRYLDLFKPSSIREFAADFNNTVDRLDILVNNAGCAGPKLRLADNGVDIVMQVNHIGPFLLTNLLLDKLKASKPSRIVIVSSKMHYIGNIDVQDLRGVKTNYHCIRYANSKLCNVLWAKALAKRLPAGITVNSLHPGFVQTDIFKRMGIYTNFVTMIARLVFKTADKGAQTTIHLCVAPELQNCLGRTGVLIACYLVYSLRVRANDAIRLVRKKRPRSVQTSGQILCVQQFEHYLLPQTVVFSSKEPLMLTKDHKTAEFTLKQYLYRQRATLHGLEERAFRELPKIVYCLCERLLKLCGSHQSAGLDFRIKNRPFYKSFLSYKLKQAKPPDPTTPEELVSDQVTNLPMVEWRDPIEEDIERNLESVSRLTGNSNGGVIPALNIHEAFIIDHRSLPDEKQKYLKQLRNDINQRKEAMARIDEEEDPTMLTGLLFEWLEGLKQPVLDRSDLSIIVGRSTNVESCVLALEMEDVMLIEYLLRFVTRLRPLAANKKVDIIKRLIASLTHQTVSINSTFLPTQRDFARLRDGTCSQVVNFMLRMVMEIQKDMVKPGRDDTDVVIRPARRLRIKAWK